MSEDTAAEKRLQSVRYERSRLQPKYWQRIDASWPYWAQICHDAAHRGDRGALIDLLLVIAAQAKAEAPDTRICAQLLLVLDACASAAGLDAPSVGAQADDEARARIGRLRSERGVGQQLQFAFLATAFKGTIGEPHDGATGHVRLPVLLVDDEKRAQPQGFAAWLDLRVVHFQGAQLRLLRAPGSALLECGERFSGALDEVTAILLQSLSSVADPALRNTAISWDLHLVEKGSAQALAAVDGRSMGAALAIGALWLLRKDVPLRLRTQLNRLLVQDLRNTAITAQLGSPLDGVNTKVCPIDAITAKLGAWIAYCNHTRRQVEPRVFVADKQPKGAFPNNLVGAGDVVELVTTIVNHHKGPLTTEQEKLLTHILSDEASPTPMPTESELRCIDDTKVKTPVKDWLSYFLHRYATWCLHANDALHMSFVRMHISATKDEHAASGEAIQEHFNDIDQLFGARDRPKSAYLLLGVAGSGKSTLLQHLEMTRARSAIQRLVTTGQLPDEVCLYLRMRDYPADQHASPLEIVTGMVQRAYPSFSTIGALISASPSASSRPLVRLLLDGINELRPAKSQTWQSTVDHLVTDINVNDAKLRCAVFSTRSHEKPQLGDRQFVVRDIRLRSWELSDLKLFFDQRRYRICAEWRLGGAREEEIQSGLTEWNQKCAALFDQLSPEGVGVNSAARSRAHALLDLFSVPMHASAQAELMEDGGPIATDRAMLFRLWLWKKLRREWDKGGEARERLRPWIDADDHELLDPANTSWRKLRGGVLPRGRLIEGLREQGWRQWQDAVTTQTHETERGRVAVPKSDVLPSWNNSDRDQWIGLLLALGLCQLTRAEEAIDLRFAFSHQLWGEFFAASGALPPRAALDAVVATKAQLTLAQLPERDIDLINSLSDDEDLAPPPSHPLQEIIKFAVESLHATVDVEFWIEAIASVNLTLGGRIAVSVRSRLEPNAHQCWDKSAAMNARYGAANPALKTLRANLLRGFTEPLLDPGKPDEANSYADIRHRREWALLLGELGGDARFELCESATVKDQAGQGVRYLKPKAEYLCRIGDPHDDEKATTYWIGDETSGEEDEVGEHGKLVAIELKPYHVSAFPVTNAEYRYFVEAGGYDDERWWQHNDAKRWRADFVKERRDEGRPLQPRGWEYGNRGNGLQPVTSISWFEATAYASWLSACEGAPSAGDAIRVLTEGEWRAAAGGEGKDYGETPKRHRRRWAYAVGNGQVSPEEDRLLINVSGTRLGTTSPVGLFPRGRTPEGVEDLSGNCWEWTSSGYTNRLDPAALQAVYGQDEAGSVPEHVALAGGNYWFGAARSRVSYRDRFVPGGDFSSLGFRLCGWRAPIKRLLDTEP